MNPAPDPLQAKRVELILQQLDQLPTLPAVAVRVLEAVADDGTHIDEIVAMIASDASLTARILQLVNSVDAAVRTPIHEIGQAVVLLGFEAVRSAVLALSVFEAFSRPSAPGAAFSREEFWKHAIAVACCAELLAEQGTGTNAVNPSEAFVAGLLHDLGKIALDAVLPKSFARVIEACELLRGNIADVERSVIGLDHMVVGKRLAERWNLPRTIADCIWLHTQAPAALPPTLVNPRLVNLITLADLLTRRQHLGYSGNYSFPISPDELAAALGLNAAALERAQRDLVGRIQHRAGVLHLGKSSTDELYQQALSRANHELGRVNDQLAAKNRRLAMRSKFFDALSAFQGELRPDSPPQRVMTAMAQTAVTVMGLDCVGVFSLAPGQAYAQVILVDHGGQVFETSLVDGPKTPDLRGICGPVRKAGDELDWLLSAISPRLPADQRFWVSLETEGACIGGVVWGATSGEAQRLAPQIQELTALSAGWALALRTSQIREEARALAEQLAESNRQLQGVQDQILKSRMLLSVGEMAAGAAHEMNNPLAVISGRSQFLAAELSDPKHKATAHLIQEQSNRLSQIITELMEYARPVPPKPQTCDTAELVDRALHAAKEAVDPEARGIEVTMQELPPVRVDQQQLIAALAEIIDNAFQATDAVKGQIAIHGAFDPSTSQVAITISDNGVGMDETTKKRAFDPFFSNKPAGRRRGMGLPKALRWIESSGGTLRLESTLHHGSRLLVLLPVAAPAAAHPAQEQSITARKAAN